MNKVIQVLRLVEDPSVRYGGANNTCVARFRGAVDRRFKREGDADADFFKYVAFGKTGEFCEKYLRKGTKVVIEGELRNANYEKDGKTVYSDEIVISAIEFAESKGDKAEAPKNNGILPSDGDFVPADGELPFN